MSTADQRPGAPVPPRRARCAAAWPRLAPTPADSGGALRGGERASASLRCLGCSQARHARPQERDAPPGAPRAPREPGVVAQTPRAGPQPSSHVTRGSHPPMMTCPVGDAAEPLGKQPAQNGKRSLSRLRPQRAARARQRPRSPPGSRPPPRVSQWEPSPRLSRVRPRASQDSPARPSAHPPVRPSQLRGPRARLLFVTSPIHILSRPRKEASARLSLIDLIIRKCTLQSAPNNTGLIFQLF